MARRKQMSDQEAMGLIAKIFIIWPLQIIEGGLKGIFALGCFISDKVKQHDTEKKQKDIVYKSLDEDQKKEVDEGNYDPYNFEEYELEDDDYYSEDE